MTKDTAIRDARQLGYPKMMLLGFQHMFAMFGATVLVPILTGLPVIRAFHTEKHEEERFDKANKDLTKLNLFVNRAMTFMMPTMMLVMNGITVLIVWVGGHSINDGAMQVGDMMAFIQYAMQIIMSFLMICMISVMLPRAAVSADVILSIIILKYSKFYRLDFTKHRPKMFISIRRFIR